MKKQQKKTYTAEEQARIDSVITKVTFATVPIVKTAKAVEQTPAPTAETKNTTAKKVDALAVVETVKSVELPLQKVEPIAPVVEPVKSFEQQQAEFEVLRIYIKEKEAKLKQLETIESNISGLEGLQTENADCEELPNIFEDGEDEEDNFVLTLHGTKRGHRRPDHFRINSPAIIEEYLDLLIDKLRLRAENLRTEIAKS